MANDSVASKECDDDDACSLLLSLCRGKVMRALQSHVSIIALLTASIGVETQHSREDFL
jgi:hypothetical protein